MAKAYVVQKNGSTIEMDRIRCKNEDQELQLILERNPNLLPGDQINPDDPRRWLIIEREMPVPDPSSGGDRWSIDFFFADQSGMPTFIECKRYEDSRSRREVIGQMFDYAANGHYYWTKGDMRNLAEKNASVKGLSLEEAIRNLQPDDGLGVDDYFQRVEDNLREGQLRLVFFLEESSMELRSVVDFLNKQMERSEVLIVEARQYLYEGTRVVVPALFGYTEEARQVKRTVTVTSASRKKWNQELFFADACSRLDETGLRALRSLYDACESFSDQIRWGTGKNIGSFNPMIRQICEQGGIISVKTDGKIELNFGWLNETGVSTSFRDDFKEFLVEEFELELPDDWVAKYPKISADNWVHKVDIFIEGMEQLVKKYL